MTNNEKNKIKTLNFNELWDYLWGNDIGIQYRCEEKSSKEKYELLKIGIETSTIVYNLNTKYNKNIRDEIDLPYLKDRFNNKDYNIIIFNFNFCNYYKEK